MKAKSFVLTVMFAAVFAICGCRSSESQVSTREIQDYLAGRPLVIPADVVTEKPAEVQPGDRIIGTNNTGQPLKVVARTIIMDKAGISAVTVGKPEPAAGAVPERNSGIVWVTPVTLIFSDGSNRYAVEAIVEHSGSDGKRVFLGYRIIKVAKQ